MRKKELKLIITYTSTSKAINMEKIFKDNNLPGRLIPLPTEISAGCGLAWACAIFEKEIVITALKKYSIQYSNIYELML